MGARRIACLLAGLLSLGLLLPGPAAGQEITHASPCHPGGSDHYPVGDSIVFTYHPPEPPPPLPKLPLVAYPPCVDVTLTARDVRGKPPLRIEWLGPEGLVGTGNPVQVDTGSFPTGVSPVTLTVSNQHGQAVQAVNLWVQHLAGPVPPPEADANPSPDLVASFRARADGAHKWRWDFGDGTSSPWTVHCGFSESTVSHTFPAPGTYAVVAYARNCRDGTVASEPLMVSVGDPDTIELLRFEAQGCGAFCVFPVGQQIQFAVETSGTPDRYLYDWDGDGRVDQVTTAPVSHAYPDFGVYIPRLTVERGEGRDELVHEGYILVD